MSEGEGSEDGVAGCDWVSEGEGSLSRGESGGSFTEVTALPDTTRIRETTKADRLADFRHITVTKSLKTSISSEIPQKGGYF